MWLEAFYASLVISAGCGATLAINALLPDETKRFLRFVEAEVSARFKRKPRHLSIEMAMHLDAEVDMKWWQAEFDKLQRATVSDDWMTLSETRVHDHLPPTSAEWGGWIDRSIREVTDGDITYSFGSLSGAEHAQHAVEKAKAEREAREGRVKERTLYTPKSTDDYELTVDLSHHAQMLAKAFGQGVVSADEFRQGVEEWSRAALQEPERCDDCEYVEEMTYASTHVKRRVAQQCRRCLAQDIADRINEISGYWG